MKDWRQLQFVNIYFATFLQIALFVIVTYEVVPFVLDRQGPYVYVYGALYILMELEQLFM